MSVSITSQDVEARSARLARPRRRRRAVGRRAPTARRSRLRFGGRSFLRNVQPSIRPRPRRALLSRRPSNMTGARRRGRRRAGDEAPELRRSSRRVRRYGPQRAARARAFGPRRKRASNAIERSRFSGVGAAPRPTVVGAQSSMDAALFDANDVRTGNSIAIAAATARARVEPREGVLGSIERQHAAAALKLVPRGRGRVRRAQRFEAFPLEIGAHAGEARRRATRCRRRSSALASASAEMLERRRPAEPHASSHRAWSPQQAARRGTPSKDYEKLSLRRAPAPPHGAVALLRPPRGRAPAAGHRDRAPLRRSARRAPGASAGGTSWRGASSAPRRRGRAPQGDEGGCCAPRFAARHTLLSSGRRVGAAIEGARAGRACAAVSRRTERPLVRAGGAEPPRGARAHVRGCSRRRRNCSSSAGPRHGHPASLRGAPGHPLGPSAS